jgi:hypothetical protein
MSRTYRSNASRTLEYCIDNSRPVEGGYLWDLHWIPVASGGWKAAKEMLSKVEYAKLRKKRGDCLTKEFLHASVPWSYRNTAERTYRQQVSKELRRYTRNADYEVQVYEKPGDARYW